MKKKLEEYTNGRATLEIFPNNQLGNEPQMIEGVLLGTVDITVPSNAPLTNFVTELKIFDMPFLFRDDKHMTQVLRGPVLKEMDDIVAKKGIRLLGVYAAGVRHIMTKEPINAMEDLKGKKIRTMQSPYHVAAFKAFGANATPLAYGELYGALQAGVVDGAEAANTNYQAQKFYEVAKNWAMVSWTTITAPLIMSQKKFNALPSDVQEALLKAGAESAVYEQDLYITSDQSKLDELKKAGVRVTQPDPTAFREAAKQAYDQFLTTPLDKRLLKMIQDIQ